MNPNLTPEQAIEVLDQVAAKYAGNRNEHLLLIEAIKMLTQLVDRNSPVSTASVMSREFSGQ